MKRRKTEYVHEGRFVAEVNVELLEDETHWSPYLTVEDSYRLDDVRDAGSRPLGALVRRRAARSKSISFRVSKAG